jgi:hypothetical protein
MIQRIVNGDCVEVLKKIPDNSIDYDKMKMVERGMSVA